MLFHTNPNVKNALLKRMLSTLDAMERKQPNINSELQINLHKLTITTTTARP